MTFTRRDRQTPLLAIVVRDRLWWAASLQQEGLAATMRAAWAHFTTAGDPASAAAPWPAFTTTSEDVLSLATQQTHADPRFAATYHCSFWAAR